MTYAKDDRVDAYIDALPVWQQAICHEVRDLMHAADPELEETIKRTVQPYFVCQGTVAALLAARTHVNVFLYDGAIVPDPDGIITAGHANSTAPHGRRARGRAGAGGAAAGDGPADHREQPRRWLAQAQARALLRYASSAG